MKFNKPEIEYYGTVNVLNTRKDLSLITDSSEVSYFLQYLGVEEENYRALFLKEESGEIVEAYGIFNEIPYLWLPVYRIVLK